MNDSINCEIRFISISLGIINELLRTNTTNNVHIAIKYIDELQRHGCKIRLIDGNVSLVDYQPCLQSKL